MCSHSWKEIGRAFSPPRQDFTADRATEEFLRQIIYGITSVELRCEKCGDIKNVLLTGKTKP